MGFNKFLYRKEIDGLRALAVIPVIFYHSGFLIFQGGFIGVDIFFVISGYLITSIIIKDIHSKNFSVLNFYERRIRRILPALFFMMLCTLPFAYKFMNPSNLKEFSEGIIASSTFWSNFLFYSQTDYFGIAAEINPLIHTWSLSVEEQFYIIFPVFFFLLWKLRIKRILFILSFIFIISLLLAQFIQNINPSSPFVKEDWSWFSNSLASFYLTPTRAWQLIMGVLVAIFLSKYNDNIKIRIKNFLSFLGFLLIIFSILFFSKSTPLPSILSLIPTLGVCLIIIYAKPNTIVHTILSNKILVGIGLISYSAYLWHQPLLAFTKIIKIENPGTFINFFICLINFLIAFISWKFIEVPFRNRNKTSKKKLFSFLGCLAFFLITFSILGLKSDGFKNRYSEKELATIEIPHANIYTVCNYVSIDEDYPAFKVCEFGDLNSEEIMFLYGDSHSATIFDVLHKKLKDNKIKGIKISNYYCDTLVYLQETRNGRVGYGNCINSHKKMLQFIKESNPSSVLIVIRWTYRLFPVENLIEKRNFNNLEGGVEYIPEIDSVTKSSTIDGKMDKESKSIAVKKLLEDFIQTNSKIFLFYPIPEAGWHVSNFNQKYFGLFGKIKENISTSYNLYLKRNKFIIEILDSLDDYKNLIEIKPSESFCNVYIKQRCVVQYKGIPFYHDGDHLSNEGANLVIKDLFRKY